jgi:hypothetical protein
VERLQPSAALEQSPRPGRDTTISRPEINVVGGIVGGVLGGVAGAALGTMIGASTASGCREEFCAFGPALVGFGLGEPIGVAMGTHIGARGRGDVAGTALSSIGILIGGLLVAAAAPRGTPALALVLIPAAQIATALAFER